MLIYGNVPRNLPGSFRYAQSALVRQTLTAGQTSDASYFETAKFMHDTNVVHCSLATSGSYEVDVEISLDDGVTWSTHVKRTQDDPPHFKIDYTSPEMKLRMNVISAANPVLCVMRQG